MKRKILIKKTKIIINAFVLTFMACGQLQAQDSANTFSYGALSGNDWCITETHSPYSTRKLKLSMQSKGWGEIRFRHLQEINYYYSNN